MASSLDSLVKNLRLDKLKENKKGFAGDKIELLLIKGVYPYNYMDSPDRFNDAKLSDKGKFYFKLSDCDISDEDYEHE